MTTSPSQDREASCPSNLPQAQADGPLVVHLSYSLTGLHQQALCDKQQHFAHTGDMLPIMGQEQFSY